MNLKIHRDKDDVFLDRSLPKTKKGAGSATIEVKPSSLIAELIWDLIDCPSLQKTVRGS